jgi:DNA-binding response OmpR family regulator
VETGTEHDALDVLLVEDDEPLASALMLHLRAERWTVRWAEDGDRALTACLERIPDVVVLDLMLPGRSGLEVCTELRTSITPSPGVVMLTARSSEGDVVLGLDHGADDYVIKPCRPKELTARIRALARRLRVAPRDARDVWPAEIVLGKLRLDLGMKKAQVGDELLSLTPSEFALLEVFMRNEGQNLSRMVLLERVFESTHAGYARNVDCHVARLRKKLDATGIKRSIETVYGSGYRFVAPG